MTRGGFEAGRARHSLGSVVFVSLVSPGFVSQLSVEVPFPVFWQRCLIASAGESGQLFIATQTSSASHLTYSKLWTGLQYHFMFNAFPFLLVSVSFQTYPIKKPLVCKIGL